MPVTEWMAALAAVLSLVVSVFAFRAAQRSADAAEKAAVAAERSAVATERATALAQRQESREQLQAIRDSYTATADGGIALHGLNDEQPRRRTFGSALLASIFRQK